jgi:2-keto-4-pentenoate hydratase/2-oxohepta-3-ene-1,7-dioic acid hydratase in catechol pathway
VRHAAQQKDDSALDITGDIYSDFEITDVPAQVHKLMAPIAPTSILAIGLNYRHHAEESGAKIPEYPILFVKGLNTVHNPNDPIEIPTALHSEQVDYECELAVVIGKNCKNVRREDALQYVLGYTCANDVSARDWQLQRGGGQWCRGKFFDTFARWDHVL